MDRNERHLKDDAEPKYAGQSNVWHTCIRRVIVGAGAQETEAIFDTFDSPAERTPASHKSPGQVSDSSGSYWSMCERLRPDWLTGTMDRGH